MKHRRMRAGSWQLAVSSWIFYCLLPIAYCLLALTACNSDEGFTQRPRGYFKIALPQKKYQLFNRPGFPYSFEYPVYGVVVQDSTFFNEKAENPYWINIQFPQFDGELHLSYKEIGKH